LKKIICCVFIVGLSLGLIISSSINLIYNKNNVKTKEAVNNNVKIDTLKINEENDLQNLEKEKVQQENNEEYVTIKIEDEYTCDEISELLYESGLISNKQDFKIMFNLKTLDIFEAGKVLTNKGLISRGWQINTLLSLLGKSYDKVLNALYEEKLIDDKESVDFFLSILKETKQIVPGEKVIKKGASINEIIKIITS
jgi:cell division protein YceG involved in septum cleavage